MDHSQDVIFDETSLAFEEEQQKYSAQSDSQLQSVVEIDVNKEIVDQEVRKVNKSPKRTRQVQISLLENPQQYLIIQNAHGNIQIIMEFRPT